MMLGNNCVLRMRKEAVMQDFLFLGTVLVFFVVAIGYTYGCARL